MIEQNLNILIVEDNAADQVLMERQIKKIVARPKILCVEKFDDLVRGIDEFAPDVILSDYQLSDFTGFDVLNYVDGLEKRIPLIFVTGTINDEELAASSILNGASGYILKKNINSLSEKLLPYLQQVANNKERIAVTNEHKQFINDFKNYIESLGDRPEMAKARYLEMKRSLQTLKSLDK